MKMSIVHYYFIAIEFVKYARKNTDWMHRVYQQGDHSKYWDRLFSWRIYECSCPGQYLLYNHSLFWCNESEPERPLQNNWRMP